MPTNLPRDGDALVLLVPHGALGRVLVVEHDGHGGTGHARLALLVHQLLQVPHAHLAQVAENTHTQRQPPSVQQVLQPPPTQPLAPTSTSPTAALKPPPPWECRGVEVRKGLAHVALPAPTCGGGGGVRPANPPHAPRSHLIPNTKQMASKMLLLPLPFSPVMALKQGSNPDTTVRVA
jgi:hypothetical protein